MFATCQESSLQQAVDVADLNRTVGNTVIANDNFYEGFQPAGAPRTVTNYVDVVDCCQLLRHVMRAQ
jgi:hypothetical protein